MVTGEGLRWREGVCDDGRGSVVMGGVCGDGRGYAVSGGTSVVTGGGLW